MLKLPSGGGAKLALGAKAKKRFGTFPKTSIGCEDMPDRQASPLPSRRGWPLFPARTGNQFRADSPRRLSLLEESRRIKKPLERASCRTSCFLVAQTLTLYGQAYAEKKLGCRAPLGTMLDIGILMESNLLSAGGRGGGGSATKLELE